VSERHTLLVLASRPSDYTEMSALARALARQGHRLHFLYFYSPTDPGIAPIIEGIRALSQIDGVTAQAVDVDEVQRGNIVGDREPTVMPAQRSQAAEIGLYNFVLGFRDRVLGKKGVSWLQRNFPTLRKMFPVVYKAARLVDVIRNLPAGVRLAWQAATEGVARQQPLSVRAKLLIKGPKVMADAAFMEQVYRRFLLFFRTTIASRRIDAVMMPEDIVGNLWPVAIRAGHDAGVPTLVFPYTLANKEEAFQSLKDQPSYQFRRNEIAGLLYPRWRTTERGADLVRLPTGHIFAHERLGISPPDPWMMNSGFADMICVDSDASLEYFLNGGIPAEQMRVVGSVSQDQMFERRQHREASLQQLRQELGLTGAKPILLISGCPNQLSATVPFCEFKTIAEVAEHVGSSIAPLTEHYHVIVRPHPNYPEFGEMLRPFGFAVSSAPTFSLVPLADLFVAFASATIRWAIACGIPAVNYDVFHYGYGDFAAAKGVTSVSGSAEFHDLMRRLTPGSSALRALIAAASADSAKWSLMDGRSVYRIEKEIHDARAHRVNAAKEQLQNA
jgi:hypothetical protein